MARDEKIKIDDKIEVFEILYEDYSPVREKLRKKHKNKLDKMIANGAGIESIIIYMSKNHYSAEFISEFLDSKGYEFNQADLKRLEDLHTSIFCMVPADFAISEYGIEDPEVLELIAENCTFI